MLLFATVCVCNMFVVSSVSRSLCCSDLRTTDVSATTATADPRSHFDGQDDGSSTAMVVPQSLVTQVQAQPPGGAEMSKSLQSLNCNAQTVDGKS